MTEETEAPIRSAIDLQMEALEARMQQMEETYKARIGELEDANRSLWAEAHKASEPTVEAIAPVYDDSKAVDAFYAALGRKE